MYAWIGEKAFKDNLRNPHSNKPDKYLLYLHDFLFLLNLHLRGFRTGKFH